MDIKSHPIFKYGWNNTVSVRAFASFELLAIIIKCEKTIFLSLTNDFLNSHVMWMKNKHLFLKTFSHSHSMEVISLPSKYFSIIWSV